MSNENIHAGHRSRLRQRFIENGLDSFLPHQKLELLLFYAIPRGDTNVHAHRLLNEFETISDVFDADPKELCKVNGIGENAASLIGLIPQIYEDYDSIRSHRLSLNSYQKICRYFESLFFEMRNEVICVACLDDSLGLVRFAITDVKKCATHTDTVRYITNELLKINCTQCMIATNRPYRSNKLTAYEYEHIKAIMRHLEALNIKLAEYVVYGNDGIRLVMYEQEGSM